MRGALYCEGRLRGGADGRREVHTNSMQTRVGTPLSCPLPRPPLATKTPAKCLRESTEQMQGACGFGCAHVCEYECGLVGMQKRVDANADRDCVGSDSWSRCTCQGWCQCICMDAAVHARGSLHGFAAWFGKLQALFTCERPACHNVSAPCILSYMATF